MSEDRASRARLPVAPMLCRVGVDAIRTARRVATSVSAPPSVRPRLAELLVVWVVERLPDSWHRYLEPRHGAGTLPVQPTLPRRRRP